MDGGSPVLSLRGVAKAYGPTQALAGASLDVAPRSIHALLGGNGSGKSTLIKILAGVVAADAGEIELAGEVRAARAQTPALARAGGLHFAHQQSSTFAELTVAENLAIGRGFETGAFGRIRWRALKRRASEVLSRFEIDVDPSTELGALGSATQMMVVIARALQDQDDARGGILVLDEPTSRLPRHEVGILLDALERYARAGQTIIYVTHRLEEVLRVAGRATVMRDGQVVATVEREQFSHDRLARLIMGREPTASMRVPGELAGAAEAVLEADGLGCDGQPLRLRAGEVVGVAGLLGSGRTSLLARLFGAAGQDARPVRIDGVQVDLRGAREAMRAGVAFVPEDRAGEGVFADLAIADNISLAQLGRHTRWGRISRRSERSQARRLMDSLQVRAASEDAPLSSLSGGNQQKVVIARWLQREPRLLLLDEPTQGVDVGARAEIHALVRSAVAQGAAALLVSSDFAELVLACDRAIVVKHGRVVAEIPGSQLSEAALNAAVYDKEEQP